MQRARLPDLPSSIPAVQAAPPDWTALGLDVAL